MLTVDDALGAIVPEWTSTGSCSNSRRTVRPGTRALLELGAGIGDDTYREGLAAREQVVVGFETVFEQVDLLAGPTVAYPAPPEDPPFGTPEGDVEGRYTSPYNLAGNPAVSLPCGLAEGNLPAGLQLAAAVGNDELLLSAARVYEEVRV